MLIVSGRGLRGLWCSSTSLCDELVLRLSSSVDNRLCTSGGLEAALWILWLRIVATDADLSRGGRAGGVRATPERGLSSLALLLEELCTLAGTGGGTFD